MVKVKEPTVTITREKFEELVRESHLLGCLDCVGLLDWKRYPEALAEHVKEFPEFYGVHSDKYPIN